MTGSAFQPSPFPRLQRVDQTSLASWYYNCHAWAADRTDVWWDPGTIAPAPWVKIYWPAGLPRHDDGIDNFKAAFQTIGYSECADSSLEPGQEKIALYAIADRTKHTARQLPQGSWTSKLGRMIDIRHPDPGSLEGPLYGQVVAYMQRPRASANVPTASP